MNTAFDFGKPVMTLMSLNLVISYLNREGKIDEAKEVAKLQLYKLEDDDNVYVDTIDLHVVLVSNLNLLRYMQAAITTLMVNEESVTLYKLNA